MRFIFFHGWGFAPKFWWRLKAQLQYCYPDAKFEFADAGYYNNIFWPALDPNDIIISHSLGTIYAIEQITKHHITPKAFINFSGFPCFIQKNDFPDGNPLTVLIKMQNGVTLNPVKFMNRFTSQCGLRGFIQTIPKKERLLQDLEWLKTADYRKEAANIQCPVLTIHAKNDPITPYNLIMNGWKKIDFITMNIALPEYQNHCLPFHIPLEIKEDIYNWLSSHD